MGDLKLLHRCGVISRRSRDVSFRIVHVRKQWENRSSGRKLQEDVTTMDNLSLETTITASLLTYCLFSEISVNAQIRLHEIKQHCLERRVSSGNNLIGCVVIELEDCLHCDDDILLSIIVDVQSKTNRDLHKLPSQPRQRARQIHFGHHKM